MTKNLFSIWFLLTIFFTPAFGASTKQSIEIDQASDEAWNYYQEKKYNEARNIVNKYYVKEHVSLSLLSGMLYASENKCMEALEAIHYVSSYYDEHGVEVLGVKSKATDFDKKTESNIKGAYQGLKKIGFVCHMKLEHWQEAINDAKIFLQYKPDDLVALLAIGNSSKQLARVNIIAAEQAFERTIESFGKNNASEIKDDENEALSAIEYARFNLAILYGWEGQHDRAVKMASRLLKESTKPQKILDGMRSSSDYKFILKDKVMVAVIKSLGL